MMVRSWISLFTFLGVFLFSSTIYGQYRVKTIDLSKTITALKTTEAGYLQYGTATGELGLYDGIVLDRSASFNSSIQGIQDDYIMTSGGLFTLDKEKKILQSPNNLRVLDYNSKLNMLLTTSGVFNKSGNDFIPNREEFYDINEVQNGKFFEVAGVDYLWIDRSIYVKDKSWKEFILHPRSEISVTSQKDKLIISDHTSIVSVADGGSIDTLYRSDTIGLTKIYALNRSDLLYCADNQVGIFNSQDKELTNIRELNTALINAVAVDRWENVWIAAGSYLYQVIDAENTKNQEPPKIMISHIQVNGRSQAKEKPIVLENENNDLEISYRGVHLTRPQDLVYQYKLSKSNTSAGNENQNKWSKPSKKREAEFRNLDPGKFRFQVRATVDDVYHTYSRTIDIRVNDDSVQYYWLAGLLGALGVFLTAIFFNARYNRLKEKSDQERKLLMQENKMLSLQQTALQLQMNPHFVFNALNSIQGLIAKEDNKKARRYLQQFSSMMRSVLNQSREEKISLEEEIAYLKSYLSLEQMANNDSFDFDIIIDPNVEHGIDIPTMIIQPFIENAIIHGVKGFKERRGVITVHFDQDGEKIKCTISDNGQGRKAAAHNKVSSHKSVALDVVRERLTGKGIKTNPIEYTDKHSQQGSPIGTEVEITIPIV